MAAKPHARQLLYNRVAFPVAPSQYATFEGPAESVMYAIMRHAFVDSQPPVIYGTDKGRGPAVKLITRYEPAGKLIDDLERIVPTIKAVVTWTEDGALLFAVGELVI